MGKKKKSDGYTSMGLHNNVSKDTLKAMRKERSHLDTMMNKYTAFKKGKNVMLTIPNPNTNETNKRFVRVNAKDVWKFNKPYIMKQNTSDFV